MAQSYSKHRRCIAHLQDILLIDDNFRKDPYPPQSSQFLRQCSFCRQARTIALGHDPSHVCSKISERSIIGSFYRCRRLAFLSFLFNCRRRIQCVDHVQSVTRDRRRVEQSEIPVNNPLHEPWNRRPPHHYDSSPDMDQSLSCEWAARNPNHPIIFLRDFIDEISWRQTKVYL